MLDRSDRGSLMQIKGRKTISNRILDVVITVNQNLYHAIHGNTTDYLI